MNHIRVTRRKSGPRLNDRGQTETFCGQPMTDKDITIADARTALRRAELRKWLTCERCLSAVEMERR